MTALAFRVEHNFKTLVELLEKLPEPASDEMEEGAAAEIEVKAEQTTAVLKQLLSVAMLADYGDETGRRKMFSFLRACDQFFLRLIVD